MASSGPKFPMYKELAQRKATYDGYWPNQLPIAAAELIINGFFYTRVADRVICYNCGGGLYNLQQNDNIFIIHYRNFPDCENIIRDNTKKFRNDSIQKNADKIYNDRTFVPNANDLILTVKSHIGYMFKHKLQTFKATVLENLHLSRKYNEILKKKNINLIHDKERLLLRNTQLKLRLERLELRLQCPVCMDTDINTTIQCGHMFCNMCVAAEHACPQCRTPIITRQQVYV